MEEARKDDGFLPSGGGEDAREDHGLLPLGGGGGGGGDARRPSLVHNGTTEGWLHAKQT